MPLPKPRAPRASAFNIIKTSQVKSPTPKTVRRAKQLSDPWNKEKKPKKNKNGWTSY